MATRTIANGGGNWSAIGSWVEGIVPIAGDAVVATATSGNLTVDVPSAATTLTLTNYVATMTFSSTLTIAGSVLFVPGMTIAGTTGALIVSASANLTSGGNTLTCALTLNGAVANYTLVDDWTVTGLLTIGGGAGTNQFNGVGRKITCNGGYFQSGSTSFVTGTAKIVITGGTWSHNNATIRTANNIDLAGNVTISGQVNWGAVSAVLTYVSGTITTTGSTLLNSFSSTLNTAGMTWNNVTFDTAATVTLSSNLAWSGTLTASGAITFSGTGLLAGPGGFTVSAAVTTTLNNTGGLQTTGTLTWPDAAATFAGSAGFTVGTMTTVSLTASRIYTVTFGRTYAVNTLVKSLATSTSRMALKSSSAGNKVIFNVAPGATQQLVYCDPTDVDSSGGQQVVSIGATITNSLNWLGSVSGGAGGGGGRVYHMGL